MEQLEGAQTMTISLEGKYLFNNLYIELGVSWYTGFGDNRDIQSNNFWYRVNLVCDDIPVLAITAIFKMNRTLMITPHVILQRQYLVDLQVAVLHLNPDTCHTRRRPALADSSRLYPKSTPRSLFPTLVHSYSSLEGVNENEWVNSDTKCTGRPALLHSLLFNSNLKRAAPVRLNDLSWTLSRKLCTNPNSQFTINLYMCYITLWTSASKIN